MAVVATPLSETTGLELTGLTGAALVSSEVAEAAAEAVARHGVLIYRGAHLDDDQLVAFSRMLGEVLVVPHGALPDHPEVAPVTRDPARDAMADYRKGTFFWHIDGANDLVPNKLTLLSAISVVDGEDTEFANTYAAHAALDAGQAAHIEGVRVVHSFAASQRLVYPDPTPDQLALWDRVPSREHPLVWHRRDGRRSLLIGASAGEVVGAEPDKSRMLLDRLLGWSTQPQFVVRHRWRTGDLVIWDNTGMLHRALPYEPSSPRLLHRTTIAGEEAIA